MSVNCKIAVVYYSVYGHVRTLADEIVSGVNASGAKATLYQIPETLPQKILDLMHAPAKDASVPVITAEDLLKYDGIIFGIPTRFGMAASQVKAFMDSTGPLWAAQALNKKTGGLFFSTAIQGGGQETTALTFLTQFSHHGMIYVPLGMHAGLSDLTEAHGGSAYGPGTLASSDGSRKVSSLEKEAARAYGERFGAITSALKIGLKQQRNKL